MRKWLLLMPAFSLACSLGISTYADEPDRPRPAVVAVTSPPELRAGADGDFWVVFEYPGLADRITSARAECPSAPGSLEVLGVESYGPDVLRVAFRAQVVSVAVDCALALGSPPQATFDLTVLP